MFLAHISDDKLRQQSISEHLLGTAKLAANFADSFGCKEWGYGCGLLHDIGKYSKKFQQRFYGGSITDHATAGARELYNKGNYIGAYCIAGHHSGLLDGGTIADSGGEATFQGRMKKELDDYHIFKKEIEIPYFPNPPMKPLGKGGFSVSFFIRILFSCLVDADFLDTENFMSNGLIERNNYDSMDRLFERLYDFLKPWFENTDIKTVNGRRTFILKACMDGGKKEQGIFQLTVPTGGGKTISSLAFALQHAKQHNLDHIIYVIPYTSIIEQNAQIFKNILGERNILEDHCNVVYESEEELEMAKLAAENWECPVVVTTNVQFFESLFSNKTSKCRKLHNISNSVIIFDEAQMLPVKYLQPCIRAISELVYNYHSTAVICTATQPSLQQFFLKNMQIRELCPDIKNQYEFFKRTTVENIGEVSEDMLVEFLKKQQQVLCILNSRKRVQRVYEELKGDGTYHLSTFMYPEHRKRILNEICERLKYGKTCRLIATSLVEAGMDFDFNMVYRELAGIDSVIQAAGRCNREGKKDKKKCKTIVFTLEKTEDIHIPAELKLPIAVAAQVARRHENIISLDAIDEYFKRLYHFRGENGSDSKDIVGQLECGIPSYLFPFASIAKQFHLIENDTKTILIDIEPEAISIVQRIRWGEHSRQLVRDAGHYCVNVYEKDFENLNGAGRLEALDMNLYVLRNKEQYTEEKGLVIDISRGEAVLF